jgi:uncharacterized DUF497 family protein
MAIYLEWDPEKARKNLRDHGVSFEDAAAVFADPYRITQEDSVVDGELRWRTIGVALGIVILLLIHLEEDDGKDLFVRMISAREATPGESTDYEQARKNDIG